MGFLDSYKINRAITTLLAVTLGNSPNAIAEALPALADDPNLDYSDAVELRLLLEQLGTA